MRLWSLHPIYLDTKGLVACWREGLLAQKVLLGLTKGYKNHPQLKRFKQSKYPLSQINAYLQELYIEADKRGFKFDIKKFDIGINIEKIKITKGQLIFEFNHLNDKLFIRDRKKYDFNINNTSQKNLISHPIFKVIDGGIEEWEKIK